MCPGRQRSQPWALSQNRAEAAEALRAAELARAKEDPAQTLALADAAAAASLPPCIICERTGRATRPCAVCAPLVVVD